jgi:hypothetical protein
MLVNPRKQFISLQARAILTPNVTVARRPCYRPRVSRAVFRQHLCNHMHPSQKLVLTCARPRTHTYTHTCTYTSRVESMMVRLARTQNYVLISPSIEQRNHQNAMQCIPLVIEPASAYYTSPVVRSSIV